MQRLRPSRALIPLLAASLATLACAKRPVFYPNAHYQAVGAERAEADAAECQALADQADLETQRAGRLAAHTAERAAAGAATGAVAGAFSGRPGRGAGIGAATAATWGFVMGLFRARDPDPLEASFVAQCLSVRGYRLVGWR